MAISVAVIALTSGSAPAIADKATAGSWQVDIAVQQNGLGPAVDELVRWHTTGSYDTWTVTAVTRAGVVDGAMQLAVWSGGSVRASVDLALAGSAHVDDGAVHKLRLLISPSGGSFIAATWVDGVSASPLVATGSVGTIKDVTIVVVSPMLAFALANPR